MEINGEYEMNIYENKKYITSVNEKYVFFKLPNGDEYKTHLEKKHPNWSANEIINCFYQNICDEKDLMLVTYDQLEQLELLKKKNDRNKSKVDMLERKWVVGKCLKAKE